MLLSKIKSVLRDIFCDIDHEESLSRGESLSKEELVEQLKALAQIDVEYSLHRGGYVLFWIAKNLPRNPQSKMRILW